MRSWVVFILVGIFFIFLSGGVSAKDLYVSLEGDDGVFYDNNNIDNPWRNLEKAWYNAQAGDNVFFRGGTYFITSQIWTHYHGENDYGYDGSEAEPITFQNYENEDVIFSSDLNTVFSLQRRYNYISGLKFVGGAATWFDLGENSAADHFKIEDCFADMSEGTGGDNDGFVRVRPGVDYAVIKNNVVIGPGFDVSANTNCLYISRAENVKILNNELSNAPFGIYFKHANAIGTEGGEIAYNYITDTSRHSIFTNSHNAYFHDNIIGEENAGVRFNEANGVPGGDNNTWDHNTILSADLQLNNDDGGADDNIFINNIIYSYTIEDQAERNIWDYNLQVTDPVIGPNDVSGVPVFVGGSNPSSISGFLLSEDILGSDGRSLGADVSLVGSGVEVAVIDPYCGDGACNGGESCESCGEDCLVPSCPDCDDGDSCTTDSCVGEGTCSVSCSNVIIDGCGEPGVDVSECENWRLEYPEWIWCDSFDDGTDMNDKYYEYTDDDGDFVPSGEDYFSSPNSMRVVYQAGEVGAGGFKKSFGRTPDSYIGNNAERASEDFDEVYWRMYVKMEGGWIGDPYKLSRATIMADSAWSQAMIAHLWTDPSASGRLVLDPASGVVGSELVTTTYNDFVNLDWLGRVAGTTEIFSSGEVGEWRCIEAHVRLNDAGSSNGVFEFWVDDNLEASRSDLNWVGSWGDYGINSVLVENYWNDGSPVEQSRYIDNFVISTERIGCVGEVIVEEVVCAHDADLEPCDGVVSVGELEEYIGLWLVGSVSMGDVMGAIGAWAE